MRVVVVGGHGRTGSLVVDKLLAAKHGVVATIRRPEHMAALVKRGAEAIVLDLEKSSLRDWATAFQGADAVVFAAGSAEGEGSALDRKGTVRTLKAAQKAGVRRYVSISALGASTGMPLRGLSDEMKDYYKQKRLAGKHIQASELDWTILEPGELTDDEGTGRVRLSEAALDIGKIAREDVAALVVAVLAEPDTKGHIFQAIGGKTPIKTAVKSALRTA
jgi:uncharacterized protein YbjT (DUF2867 family)